VQTFDEMSEATEKVMYCEQMALEEKACRRLPWISVIVLSGKGMSRPDTYAPDRASYRGRRRKRATHVEGKI
jgi:hypothetical protein